MIKKFQIGDSVIALSSAKLPNQPRTKGSVYDVTRIMYCTTSGAQFINIGDTTAKGISGYLKCDCGQTHKHHGFAFSYSSNFILNDPKAFADSLEEAVENEDWDGAIFIRDLTR
jgi:hypothetical protein